MKDTEKKILADIVSLLNRLPEIECARLLGFIEGLSFQAAGQETIGENQ